MRVSLQLTCLRAPQKMPNQDEQKIAAKCSIGRIDLRRVNPSHSLNFGVELNRFAYEPL